MRIFTFSLMVVLGTGFIWLLSGCQPQKEAFDRKAMLLEIANDYVLPTLMTLETDLKKLEFEAQQLVDQPNTIQLQKTQDAWRRAIETWSTLEMLYFGPGRENYLYLQLDNTPVATNYIENVIADTIIIDSLLMRDRSSYTKGLATVEYLLFEGNTGAVNVVDQYANGPERGRRKAYLMSTIQYTKGLVQTLHEKWRPDGGNYAGELSNLLDNSTTGGISRFSNAVVHMSQTVARKKIGKPLGKESGAIDPSLVESPYANHTWAIIVHNLEGIEAIIGALNEQRLGALLTDQTGSTASTMRILGQIDTLRKLLQQRTNTLATDLVQDPAAVEETYQAARKLYNLLRSEIDMALSITILTNPDDGD